MLATWISEHVTCFFMAENFGRYLYRLRSLWLVAAFIGMLFLTSSHFKSEPVPESAPHEPFKDASNADFYDPTQGEIEPFDAIVLEFTPTPIPTPTPTPAQEKICPSAAFDLSKCPIPIPEHMPVPVASTPNKPSDRPLISYVYAESDYGRPNLEFFVEHGIHDAADFLFILNGETNVSETVIPQGMPNVKVVKRDNTCFDLGTQAEVLSQGEQPLKDKYKRFILMNASIRGPLVPRWSRECWSDAYLGKLTDKVKLVGSTLNCDVKHPRHVQSMIWATDSIGLNIIISPEGVGECFTTILDAMTKEVATTPLIRSEGYEVDVMMTSFGGEGGIECEWTSDFLWPEKYFGFDVHPFETMFMKSARGIGDEMLKKLTEWQGEKGGYRASNFCKA